MRPDGIIVFERLMLTSLAMSVALWVVMGLFKAMPITLLVGIAINACLVLLVSRRRNEIVSYVVLGLYVMRLIAIPELLSAYLLVSPAILIIPVGLLQIAIEGFACLMLITPKVRYWLTRRQLY